MMRFYFAGVSIGWADTAPEEWEEETGKPIAGQASWFLMHGRKGDPGNVPLKASQRFFNRVVIMARQLYDRLIRIRGTPHEIGMGMALGLYIGMTPLMGAHMVIAVFFAMMLKWNKLSAAIGVWVTNPLTALPIYGINYMVGAYVTGVTRPLRLRGELHFSLLIDILMKAPEIFWTLLVGGMITGIPLAIAGILFHLRRGESLSGGNKAATGHPEGKDYTRKRKDSGKGKDNFFASPPEKKEER
jgi:uncharacterized protein